jgi:RNA polymerase sigma-70 factor (ECF subfamily)
MEGMTSDQQELARELVNGSTEAWRTLYDAYSEAVWRCVARRVGPHPADVADIVQETFLAAARAARAYDAARGSLWVWLSGIARRQAALHFRRKQTRPSAVGNALRGVPGDRAGQNATEGVPYRIADWLDDRADDPAELLLAAETAAAVRETLRALPVEYELLLVGKYLDGLSLEELAAAEDSTAEAISSKLARARRAFRESFAQLAGTEEQPAH